MEIKSIDNAPIGRATGNTFRHIMESLMIASSGETIILIVGTQRIKLFIRDKIRVVLSVYFGDCLKIKKAFEVNFPNKGKVILLTRDEYIKKNISRVIPYSTKIIHDSGGLVYDWN